MVSEAKIRANNKHTASTYDKVTVYIRKDHGGKELVQEAAARAGETTGVYIMRAVYDRMAAEGITVPAVTDRETDGEKE